MGKNSYFNVIDLGSSKIRFASFDNNLEEKFSESIEIYINENLQSHFEAINKIIKKYFIFFGILHLKILFSILQTHLIFQFELNFLVFDA